MLYIARSLRELDFSRLMAVYAEGNAENAEDLYPEMSAGERLLRAEQDFYVYLQSGFFTQDEDRYCIWEEKGIYVCALRLQKYQDGLLLEALETHPSYRRQGYAKKLITAVLEHVGSVRVYSHIGHRNLPSQGVHLATGFVKIANHARYADGSVNDRCGTYLYEAKNASH